MYVTLFAALALALTATTASGQLPRTADALNRSYDELMRSSADAREATLRQMDVAQRLALKRIHAQRWLEVNRPRLRVSQAALVQQAIDLMSPERVRDPQDRMLMKQETELAHRLACSLGEERASAAFTFRDEPSTPDQSWAGLVDSWTQWLVDCVAR